MSHSGNSSSRRLKSLQKLQAGKEGEQLYNPSVFRYKCIGYLHMNSENKGSYGTCRGFQSRLERVANMVPDTREGAIKKFLDASSDLGTYVDSDDSSDQKVKEIYTARTMIYKEDNKWKDDKTPRIQAVKPSPFPEDELINKTDWSCWGSTSVHYLELDPIPKSRSKLQKKGQLPTEETQEKKAKGMFGVLTEQLKSFDKNFDKQFEEKKKEEKGNKEEKENSSNPPKKNAKEVVEALVKKQGKGSTDNKNGKVSAITPENIGVSIRKIDSSVGHFTVTDIGSIRICVETSASLIGDSKSTKSSSIPLNNKDTPQQVADNKGTTIGDQVQNGDKPDELSKYPMELKKFYDFTIKVGHQMVYNVKEIREAVRDDFPGRTYRFGTKVVNRFQKTSEQTFSYTAKILNSWWKSM